MTVVIIDYNVSEDKILLIKAHLTHEQNHNVNFNGEVFEVKKGNFTEILTHDDNDPSYIKLFNEINDIIRK